MKNVLVLFGGKSSEYEVSLLSAYSVITNIPSDKYTITTVGIAKTGEWYLFEGEYSLIPSGKWLEGDVTPAAVSLSGDSCVLALGEKIRKIKVDVCFPVLHGKNGEDGTLQGLLRIAGIPFVGCDTLSSAMCMDKAVTNTLADAHSVEQAKWLSVTKEEYDKNPSEFAEKCVKTLSLPVFIKPANAGSSVGITKAKTYEEILSAARTAFEHDSKLVAEEAVVGRELECAVLGNENPVASCVGEIVTQVEFYDYEAKYISSASELFIPADIPEEKSEEIRRRAVEVFKIMGCSGLSRVDFFLSEDGGVKFNEINTMPGFTSISMYSKLFSHSGISYGELIDSLISLAEQKQ